MAQVKECPQAKVAIVGAGFVGSTIAYSLMLGGEASEIALIDVKKSKAEGELLDLKHCMQFTRSVSMDAGDDFALVKDAAVVIIAAGIAQKPGQSRSELLKTNVDVLKKIVPEIVRYNKDCIILVVTNPLDVLTYVTWRISHFPPCRIFGSGTVLDTARLRYLMGQYFQISPKDITAYILGEHGDSEFMWLSGANVAGVPLTRLHGYDSAIMDTIYKQTKNAVYEIIEKKGATYYAIALVVAKIVRAILLDQSRVFTVSAIVDNVYGVQDVCLSVPVVVRRSGTCEHLALELDTKEQALFVASAQKVKKEIDWVLAQ